MNILVIGSGAREHVIVWKCCEGELVDNVFCFPGNAGIAMIADVPDFIRGDEKVDLTNEKWLERLADFAREKLGGDGLTIIGPDNPLAAGIVDYFHARDLLILGPTRQAALIESSKVFAKNLMTHHDVQVPTAKYQIFAFADNAKRYVREHEPPFVIKRNELAYGKGVVIARSAEEANETIDHFFSGKNASKLILIEEFLEGWECSFTVLSDGENFVPFLAALDYKQLGVGPEEVRRKMTGGMGGICPHPRMTDELFQEIIRQIMSPIIRAMREIWRHPFVGFLYAGLIITPQGPKVLEFNARLGDPEAQVILPLLQTDFVKLCLAAAQGRLNEIEEPVLWSDDFTVNLVLASRGYPDDPVIIKRIYGLEEASKEGALIFRAGQKGRILSVVGRGESVEKAREMAYRAAEKIRFGSKKYPRQVYRQDIGLL